MNDSDVAERVEEKFDSEFGGKWEVAHCTLNVAVLEETTNGRAVARACKFVCERHNLDLQCVYGVEMGGTRIVVSEA